MAHKPDPNLVRLPAPALHGTFAKAYSLLTRLAAKIGWDDLLKTRSSVFVMEEEYRMLKAKEEERKTSISQSPKTATTTQTSESQSNKKEEEQSKLTEKMENIDLNDESKPGEMPRSSLERPQQAAEESKVTKDRRHCAMERYLCETKRMQTTRTATITVLIPPFRLAISDYVNGGWTICSWSCTRTCEFTPFGGQKQVTIVLSRCRTARRGRNGNCLVILHFDSGTR